jgi:hypothetical protein
MFVEKYCRKMLLNVEVCNSTTKYGKLRESGGRKAMGLKPLPVMTAKLPCTY